MQKERDSSVPQETPLAKNVARSTHTPGPWRVEHAVDHEWDISAPTWMSLAVVFGNEDEEPRLESEGHANARLIAAAPELLEALLKLREKFLDLYGCYPPPHGTGEKYHRAMLAADYAIKKARGE